MLSRHVSCVTFGEHGWRETSFAAFAEFEQTLMLERQRAGIEKAKKIKGK